jgi:tetratricopeptide (TPR) repeat protein
MRVFGRLVLLALLTAVAAPVPAECLPSGRTTFAEGLAALGRGDLQTAFARFEKLVQEQPDCAEARNNLAVVLFEMGLHEEADKQLRQAVELNPDYQRARFNLRRVEKSFHGAAPKPEVETALTPEATVAPQPSAAPAAAQPTLASLPTPAAPTPSAPPPVPGVPANLAALEPQGATACVLDAARKQLCVYRRTPTAIVEDGCSAILSTHVASWPPWVVASDLTSRRVRLVDDTHHRRLRVVPDGVQMDDSVTVRKQDFEALGKKVAPWRTGWLVLSHDVPAVSAAVAALSLAHVRDALERWRQAWEAKDLNAYAAFYAPSFVPQPEADVARWRARKQSLFERSSAISVAVAPPSVFVLDEGSTVVTVFEQSYRSGSYASHDLKALRWQRLGDRWLIAVETTLAETARPSRARRRHGG